MKYNTSPGWFQWETCNITAVLFDSFGTCCSDSATALLSLLLATKSPIWRLAELAGQRSDMAAV